MAKEAMEIIDEEYKEVLEGSKDNSEAKNKGEMLIIKDSV